MRIRAMVFSTAVLVGLHTWRECPGQHQPPGGDFEQEFKNLDMPPSLVEVAAPSVQSVAANEVTVPQRTLRIGERFADLLGQVGNVLRVLEDRYPLPVLVRGDAVESLKHFVAADLEAARSGVII